MNIQKETIEKLKPWGKEIWFAYNKHYAGKILQIKKGHRYSLQYHEEKIETQYLYKGKVKFIYGTDKDNLQVKILTPGDKMDIEPYTIHRAYAIEDSEIIEVSTPNLDDVVKLDDDYGRSGKGNNHEVDINLHQKLIKNN